MTLGTGEYSVIEMSFAHSGTVGISTADSALTRGLFIIGYLSPNDKIDVSNGEAVDYIRYASGESGAPDYAFTYTVESGQVYYLITRNVSADDALTTTITIVPPEKMPEAQIYLGGEMKRANCRIYTDGAWREAEPYIFFPRRMARGNMNEKGECNDQRRKIAQGHKAPLRGKL